MCVDSLVLLLVFILLAASFLFHFVSLFIDTFVDPMATIENDTTSGLSLNVEIGGVSTGFDNLDTAKENEMIRPSEATRKLVQ